MIQPIKCNKINKTRVRYVMRPTIRIKCCPTFFNLNFVHYGHGNEKKNVLNLKYEEKDSKC